MASADASSPPRWTASDRALLRRVARRMIDAGLWSSVDSPDPEAAASFVRIFCRGRADPAFELGRAPDGRYMLIDRGSDAVSFHDSLADALAKVAFTA